MKMSIKEHKMNNEKVIADTSVEEARWLLGSVAMLAIVVFLVGLTASYISA